LVDVINTKNNEDLSALIASAFISSTYKVESTRSIVNIWNEIREKIKISNNLELVSSLLTLGRMMDLKNELPKERYIEMFGEIKTTFIEDLKKRGHKNDLKETSIVIAMITAACISRTEEIETVNEIINQWEEISDKIEIKDDLDKISGVLTIGRINEYKYNINNIEQIISVHSRIKDYIKDLLGSKKIDSKDMAAAFLASAYLEITPKVERIQDMVKFWKEMRDKIDIKDSIDYVTTLLTSGRIRDLNAQFFLTDNSIFEIRDTIKKYINSKD
jgi:hypothetical protein